MCLLPVESLLQLLNVQAADCIFKKVSGQSSLFFQLFFPNPSTAKRPLPNSPDICFMIEAAIILRLSWPDFSGLFIDKSKGNGYRAKSIC